MYQVFIPTPIKISDHPILFNFIVQFSYIKFIFRPADILNIMNDWRFQGKNIKISNIKQQILSAIQSFSFQFIQLCQLYSFLYLFHRLTNLPSSSAHPASIYLHEAQNLLMYKNIWDFQKNVENGYRIYCRNKCNKLQIIKHFLKMTSHRNIQEELQIDLHLQQLIQLTKDLLNDLIQSQGTDCQSMFNSQEEPSISLEAYLRRLHKYTRYSPQCLVIAILYLDKYNMAETSFSLNKLNVHRIFLTCLMMAVKFHDDMYFDNLAFGMGGGVMTSQLFSFELQIFEKIGFNAFVDQQDYDILLDKIYSVYADQQQCEN